MKQDDCQSAVEEDAEVEDPIEVREVFVEGKVVGQHAVRKALSSSRSYWICETKTFQVKNLLTLI